MLEPSLGPVLEPGPDELAAVLEPVPVADGSAVCAPELLLVSDPAELSDSPPPGHAVTRTGMSVKGKRFIDRR